MSLASLTKGLRQTGTLASPPAQRRWRPTLLGVTAVAAAIAAVANAASLAAQTPSPVPTRLGTSIAESMSERDRTMAERRRALDLREQAQRAAEQRLKAAVQAGQSAPGTDPMAQPGANPAATEQENVFDDLARIYQTMKPARAAPIFEKLAIDIQVQVAKRMRERATAQIMAAMSADAAVELSMALAGRQVARPQLRAVTGPRPAPRPPGAGPVRSAAAR